MTKTICDRCGKEITGRTDVEQASFINGYGIIEVHEETWRFLDLCDQCLMEFGQFLANKKEE